MQAGYAAGLVLLFVGLALLDVPALLRRRRFKQLALYGVVYAAAAALSVMVLLRIYIGDPNAMITAFVRWITPM